MNRGRGGHPTDVLDRAVDVVDGGGGRAAAVPGRRPLVFALVILFCFAASVGLANGVSSGLLTDTDAYTWVYRATELRTEGAWFDNTLDRVNPPDGHVQHWSRPFDLLLLVGGVAGEPFVGFDAALLAWAMILPCLLGVATLCVLWWGFSDVLDPAGREAVGLLFALQPAIVVGFMAGRSDHHTLMGLLMVAIAGLVRRAARVGGTYAVAAGALSGLALWVGMEAALLVMGIVGALALQWVVAADGALRTLRTYAVTMGATAAVALLHEHGVVGMWRAELDELSPTLVAATALLAVTCHALLMWDKRLTSPARRLLALLAAALVAGAALIAVSPGVTAGPLGDVDPLYGRTRLRHIGEFQPLVALGPLITVGTVAAGLSLVPFALALVAHRVRARTSLMADGQHILLLPALVYLPLAVAQQRWTFQVALLLVVPAALSVQRLMHAAAPRAHRVHLGMVTVAVVAAVWWVPFHAVAQWALPDAARCDTDRAVAALAPVEPSVVMAFVDYAPELLVRTDHSVLSIPNHRPQPGYTATYRAMTTTDPGVAHRLMAAHDVGFVLVCTDGFERAFYGGDPASVHSRLAAGDAPAWLERLPVAGGPPRFRLYRVRS